MRNPARRVAVTAALALAATAALAGDSLAGSSGFTVREKEFSLAGVPKTITRGTTEKITVHNVGKVPHSLLVDGPGVSDRGIHNKNALAGGASGAFTLTFAKPGKYRIYCAIRGHAKLGMQATIVVR